MAQVENGSSSDEPYLVMVMGAAVIYAIVKTIFISRICNLSVVIGITGGELVHPAMGFNDRSLSRQGRKANQNNP